MIKKSPRLMEAPTEILRLIDLANTGIGEVEEKLSEKEKKYFAAFDDAVAAMDEYFRSQGSSLTEWQEKWEREVIGEIDPDDFSSYRLAQTTIQAPDGRRHTLDLMGTPHGRVRDALLTVVKLGDAYQRNEPALINIRQPDFAVTTDWQGGIKFLESEIIQTLQGVPAYRIKLCPICDKIFWAGRRDMKACSNVCAGTLRTRIHRKRRRKDRHSIN